LRYTTTTFATTKRNPNTSIIDQPSTRAPLHEHNSFGRKRNGESGTISSTSHFKSGYFFDDSFFRKPKVVKKNLSLVKPIGSGFEYQGAYLC
jgi:hypothetical protein